MEEEKTERFSGSLAHDETYFGPKFCPGLLSSSYNLTFWSNCTFLQRAWWGVLKYVTYTQYIMMILIRGLQKASRSRRSEFCSNCDLPSFLQVGDWFLMVQLLGKVISICLQLWSARTLWVGNCLLFKKIVGENVFLLCLQMQLTEFPRLGNSEVLVPAASIGKVCHILLIPKFHF